MAQGHTGNTLNLWSYTNKCGKKNTTNRTLKKPRTMNRGTVYFCMTLSSTVAIRSVLKI